MTIMNKVGLTLLPLRATIIVIAVLVLFQQVTCQFSVVICVRAKSVVVPREKVTLSL